MGKRKSNRKNRVKRIVKSGARKVVSKHHTVKAKKRVLKKSKGVKDIRVVKNIIFPTGPKNRKGPASGARWVSADKTRFVNTRLENKKPARYVPDERFYNERGYRRKVPLSNERSEDGVSSKRSGAKFNDKKKQGQDLIRSKNLRGYKAGPKKHQARVGDGSTSNLRKGVRAKLLGKEKKPARVGRLERAGGKVKGRVKGRVSEEIQRRRDDKQYAKVEHARAKREAKADAVYWSVRKKELQKKGIRDRIKDL